jgi:hypothetical protein
MTICIHVKETEALSLSNVSSGGFYFYPRATQCRSLFVLRKMQATSCQMLQTSSKRESRAIHCGSMSLWFQATSWRMKKTLSLTILPHDLCNNVPRFMLSHRIVDAESMLRGVRHCNLLPNSKIHRRLQERRRLA